MSATDVRDLTSEKLPVGKFPAESRADFRFYMSPEVRRGIEQHAKADVSVEICGVLVGRWGIDDQGPYSAVTDYIRCENASSKFAEVTFTHESWAQINKEMDSRFVDERIVGWYHSHPDFGIFLSERDCFIQEHFFSAPGQVAYVIDPVRDLEGVFAWRRGKPAPLPHFWIGNEIRTVEASQRNVAKEMAPQGSSAGANGQPLAESRFRERPPLGFATTALGILALFMLGYLYGSWRSSWEQQMIIEGAVAHFANTKMIRPGLEQEVAGVRLRLAALSDELEKLPAPTAELSKEEAADAVKRRKLISDNLVLSEQALARIEQEYGLSPEERAVLALIAAQKQAELRRMAANKDKADPAKPADKASAKTKDSKSRVPAPSATRERKSSTPTAKEKESRRDAETQSTLN